MILKIGWMQIGYVLTVPRLGSYWFGSRKQLSNFVSAEINVNGETIKHTAYIKYLGVWVDDKLNFKVHIANKCCFAMWNLQKRKEIHDILTEETCKTLVMGLVILHLDYVNAIFGLTTRD